MKLVINASSIYKGGAEQVVLSFIQECMQLKEHEYHILLRENISKQLNEDEFSSNFKFYNIKRRPGSGLLTYFKEMKRFRALEKKIKPDCVISTGGHGYWRPKVPLVSGFNIPHFVYPESPYFKQLSIVSRIKWQLKKAVHLKFYGRADALIVQTDDVNQRLNEELPGKPIYTVSNTVNSYFHSPEFFENKLPERESGEVRLLTLSSYYPHKNIEIIRDVIDYFEDKNDDPNSYKFVLTLPDEIFKKIFEERHRKHIYNIGFIPIRECPSLYNECDFMFLPTLLECFSASYAEAMAMQKPILTSDLGFAHTVCEDAATYFDPVDSKDIASKIIQLSNDKSKQSELINAGKRKLKEFNTPKSRAEKFLSICKNLVKDE